VHRNILHRNKALLMRDFRKVLARLQAYRSKFERLLTAARAKAPHAPPSPHSARLREVAAQGANPGNLRMFVYAPEHLPPRPPLVVALHGCSQSADEFDYGTGWSRLADSLGFVVLYPQQQPANNPRSCFSWFLPGNIARGHGEAHSIREMIEHAIAKFGADRRKVFVTGLSAGGAMASVMLATYPEVFAGGAIIAGLPYGCAHNVEQAFQSMFSEQGHPAQLLGDRVRAASTHRGPWPRISIWHGTRDPIVKPCNSENILRQWINVHGLGDSPSYEETIGRHVHRVWTDAQGQPLIEAFSIAGMAHGVPLSTTSEKSCGAAGAFFLDVGISSTHHIARFWSLGDSVIDVPHAAAGVPAATQIAPERGALVTGGLSPESAHASCQALSAESEARQTHYPFDANAVIAAAFKAAGLPVPDAPAARPSAGPHVAPGPIIAAALKAAGLARG
jgi:poly(hydroxyalkanoate) depolymerase family esterase